jgi:hypothetical protein
MVLDFSNQESKDMIPAEEVNKPPSGIKSKSTSPNIGIN